MPRVVPGRRLLSWIGGTLLLSVASAGCVGAGPASSTPAAPSPPAAAAPVASAPGSSTTADPKASAAAPNRSLPPSDLTEPVQLAKETLRKTAWGATFTVPAGWFLGVRADHVLVSDPERELTLVLTELEGPSARPAAARLFERLGRGLPAKVRHQRHETSVGGWDEVLETHWETPDPAASVLAVNARRKGGRIWATLIEGSQAAFSRRGAQVRQVVLGLKAPGVEDENLASHPPLQLEGERARQLAAFIEQARQKARVPGVAVAVVQGGKVVLAQGFGHKTHGKNDPVTARTRFMIGSVTKSLSSLLIAKLVDEGKVRWDTPVQRLAPSFSTADATFTARLKLADTFCACTGMPRRDLDFVFEYARTRPRDIFGWFKDSKPTTGFGETFQYSNQMTALGGFLAAQLARPGRPLAEAYSEAMQAKVFAPMGMKDTTASYDQGRRGAASPHGVSLAGTAGQIDEPVVLPFAMESFVRPVAPAGSVFSTAQDMARYALVELGRGRTPEGTQVISSANLLERRKPRVKMGADDSYGLGMGVRDRNHLQVLHHDGGTFGFTTRFLLIPERDLGLVILTNSSGSGGMLLEAITQRLMELGLGARERAATELDRAVARRQTEGKKLQGQIRGPVPPALAARLGGRWQAPRLGEIRLLRAGGELVLDVGEWKSRLGYVRTPDGVERLFLLDPPLGGLPLRLTGGPAVRAAGAPAGAAGPAAAPAQEALLIDFGQDTFRFARRR